MRDHSQHISVSRWEAVNNALSRCDFAPMTEIVPVAQSVGRVLARDAVAMQDMPNCLTCSMDSVAVHWKDFEGGMPDTSAWERGMQWEFANTGVGMPEGFDTAIVVEHVVFSENDTRVAFDAMPSKQFAGTIPAGNRMHVGDVLVPAGTRVTPLLAAHIASGNNIAVEVLRRPRVAFLPTGSELVNAGDETPRGMNIESNSLLMEAKIEAWGGEPVLFAIVPDDRTAIEHALRDAAACADIVVLNAGSSKGNDDYSLEVLEEIGEVLNHETNHGPGHHSSYSILDGVPIVGISGPPGGAAFTTDFYLHPLMQSFQNQPYEPVCARARLAGNLPGKKHAHVSNKNLPGEKRPKDMGAFFSVQQVRVYQGADGVIEAMPLSAVRPGPLQAEEANAYYFRDTEDGAVAPGVGDFIDVEFRPGCGLFAGPLG